MKNSLTDVKHIIWDHLALELKKFKDYFAWVEDEKELASSCLTRTPIFQEGLGDKPLIALNVIKYLDSKEKSQLSFSGINDKADLIIQARKYIMKDVLVKYIIEK